MSIRYAFGLTGTHTTAEIIETCQKVEALGFETIWLSEDYFDAGIFSLLGAAAVKTEKINFGIGVINPYTRHPTLTAMEAAATDEISGGRLILGLGASNKRWMEMQAGIPFKKPITATTECARIIKKLMSGDPVSFSGEYFKINDVQLHNKPVRPDLPIYFGVKGPRALGLAGQYADGVLLSAGSPVEYVKYARALVRDAALKAGRDPDSIKISAYLPIYCDDGDPIGAIDKMRPMTARYLGLHGDHPILKTAGITADEFMPYREAFLSGSQEMPKVPDHIVDKLVIAGDTKKCLNRLQQYIDAGVDEPVLFEVMGVCSIDENLAMLSRLLPKLKN